MSEKEGINLANVKSFVKIDKGWATRVRVLLKKDYSADYTTDYIRKVLNEKSSVFNEIVWNCILRIAKQNVDAQKQNIELENRFG